MGALFSRGLHMGLQENLFTSFVFFVFLSSFFLPFLLSFYFLPPFLPLFNFLLASVGARMNGPVYRVFMASYHFVSCRSAKFFFHISSAFLLSHLSCIARSFFCTVFLDLIQAFFCLRLLVVLIGIECLVLLCEQLLNVFIIFSKPILVSFGISSQMFQDLFQKGL